MSAPEHSWGDGTRCVHAGAVPAPGRPLAPQPVLASAYHLGGELDYGGVANPGWTALEAALGALDGGTCVAFTTGMAATAAVLRTVLAPGEVVVLPADGYYAVRALCADELARGGVTVRTVPTAGPWTPETVAGARLVLLETPANPGLDVCDLTVVSALAHAAGALVAVDNTTATPLGQRPLDLGADLCLSSDTKAVAGHSDVLLGHVSAADPALADRLRTARRAAGATPGPFEAWQVHRGLSTLDLRLARQCATAAALADALRGRGVAGVRWPGAAWDPAHPVAARQMRRFGGVLGFTLPSAADAERFVDRCALVADATSFGGVHSSADRRARWGDPVAPGFVRFSCGIEDTADVVADVLAALPR